jgi:WS/DGAT/MGAT family acyltransferase
MAEIEFDDWMSENDAVMWHMERDPLLRSTITTVWVLDCQPDQSRFDEMLSRATAAIPRLRQRVVADSRGIAPPKWETDPLFEPDYHIRHGRVGGDGTLRDLLDAAEPIAMQAFDKDRPLWELHQLDGLEGGKVGVVMKLHHAVGDGMGLVQMTTALIETERHPDELPPVPEPLEEPDHRSTETEHRRSAIRHQAEVGMKRGMGGAAAMGRGAWNMARDPIGTSRSFAETTSSIARAMRPVSEPMSPIMGDRSMAVGFHEMLIDVDRLKAAGKATEGTINDVYVAAMLGGLARYHRHHGAPVDELRMTMPIDIRTSENKALAGNVFAPARFTVPLGIDDPVERIATVHELIQRERSEPAYPRVGQIATGLFALGPPVFTRLTSSMLKAIDFVTSNVPGPPFPVYSAGALIERFIPLGPLSGAGANLTLYSYNGVADIGINVDRAAVPDGDVFTSCLRDALDEVAALG